MATLPIETYVANEISSHIEQAKCILETVVNNLHQHASGSKAIGALERTLFELDSIQSYLENLEVLYERY